MLKFPTEVVDSHITRIYAFGTELMYLIEGTKKNVLIDTGSGFGSLKGAVDEILAAHGNTNSLEKEWVALEGRRGYNREKGTV